MLLVFKYATWSLCHFSHQPDAQVLPMARSLIQQDNHGQMKTKKEKKAPGYKRIIHQVGRYTGSKGLDNHLRVRTLERVFDGEHQKESLMESIRQSHLKWTHVGKPFKGKNIRQSHPRWTHIGKAPKGENIRQSHQRWTHEGQPSKSEKLLHSLLQSMEKSNNFSAKLEAFDSSDDKSVSQVNT